MICAGISGTRRRMMKFVALHVAGKARLSMVYLIAMDATNLRRRDLLTATALANGLPCRYMVIDAPWKRGAGMLVGDLLLFLVLLARTPQFKKPGSARPPPGQREVGKNEGLSGQTASTMGRSQMRSAIPESSDPQKLWAA